MSSNTQNNTADDIRKAFSGLPVEQKISTLLRIELDMIGDAVEAVASVASKAVDEVAAAFSESCTSNKTSTEGQPSATEA